MEKYVHLAFCRSLGVHISKVRSIQLDAWEPELLKVTYFYFLFVSWNVAFYSFYF
jgi:hypothetical protein